MFTILIAIALFLVFAVLMTGIVSMVKGGEFNRKYGNKLMRLRVLTQAIAIGLLGLAFLFDN
ncbi:twin transmembrane helix small protein [Minwuia sp.]|uniref:twin transmembrane helix small protein n=1 Tax=Minwuia sp. TaxID=2493630 RepID=UPI003A8EDA22